MDQKDREILLTLVRLADRFRLLDPEMPLQTFQTFCLVAARGELPMTSLRDRLNLSGSAVSRNVATFTHNRGKGEPGFGLFSAEEDRMDRRLKRVSLTGAGLKLAEDACAIIREGLGIARRLKAVPAGPQGEGI